MEKKMLLIIAAECKCACANEPNLIERIEKAMKPVADSHWMVTDEDVRFRGAVAAILMDPLTTDEDKNRIEFTLRQLRFLNAMMSGIPIDIEAMASNPDEIDAVPLARLWQEAKSPSST